MMSKKWTFSLTSLIAILTLAFVAPAAMAADFKVSLAEHADQPDIGAAPGLQVERPADNTLKVKVMFGEFVELATTDVSVGGFEMDGTYIPAVVPAKVDPADKAADEFTLEITITAETSRVTLMIAKGLASANAFSKNTSKELKADIYLYSPDVDINPEVYGIRRADNSSLPLTGGAVNVVITLSEEPASFTAAHINVDNATAGAPVKLNTVRQNAVGLSQFATHIDKPLLKEVTPIDIRDGILKAGEAGGNARDEYDFKGINYYLSTVALVGGDLNDKATPDKAKDDDIPGDYFAAVNKLKAAIGAANTPVNYYWENDDGVVQTAATIEHGDTDATPGNNVGGTTPLPLKDGDKLTGSVIPPTKKGSHDLTNTGNTYAQTLIKEAFDRSKEAKDYKRPLITDFDTKADYDFAVELYELQTQAESNNNADNNASDQRKAYNLEKAIYDAYIELQELIQKGRVKAMEDREKELIAEARKGDTTQIAENVLPPTGRDGMLHPYAVTITPTYATANDIVVKVNSWQNAASEPGVYKPPVLDTGYAEGFDKLTIPVSSSAVKTPTAVTPTGVIRITFPAGFAFRAASPGFTVIAIDPETSGIAIPGGSLPAAGHTVGVSDASRTPAQMKYDVASYPAMRAVAPTLPPFPNLRTFLLNGGTIRITGPAVSGAAPLVISEVMWGTDLSLDPHTKSQWLEIKNVMGTTVPSTGVSLDFVPANVPLTSGIVTGAVVYDSVQVGVSWIKGQSGRTGVDEAATAVAPVAGQVPLVSMQRVFTDPATQLTPVDGTTEEGWAASTRPSVNFDTTLVGERIGSPGDDPVNPPPAPVKKLPPVRPPTPIAGALDIEITEIMVDTSSDRFPQWIELTHVGTGKVSLNGWKMVIDNAIDGEVLGGGNAITVKLDGVELDVSKDTRNAGEGQSVLVVAWASGRKSDKIRSNGVLNVGPQLGEKGRYQLLSYEGFRITLVPANQSAIAAWGDIAGNLDEDWDILMLEGPKRSSMIRREMSTAGAALKGTDAAGWVLASATPLIMGPETYYGNDEDAGTPGYDAGGPLPVELSHFRPARDKQTGAVVITWATQSELNNAGFFIKRSNQRNGQFQVINATMIPGAGTTSEKQTYTYTDTTAQPNVVYYYQIEDVSLDGQRQLLTRGIRLKGHIGAAGKATTLWGELKSSNE